MGLEEAFGLVVRRKRAEQRVSQEELAGRCGLDRTYISGLERAKYSPSLDTTFRIAKALGTKPGEFIAEVEVAMASRVAVQVIRTRKRQ